MRPMQWEGAGLAMPLFGRKKATFSMGKLNPDLFLAIHSTLVASEAEVTTEDEVASGIANAIFNTGTTYLERVGDGRALREFDARFGDRSKTDRDVADAMVEWLLAYSPSIDGLLCTLINRLSDVLGKPAP